MASPTIQFKRGSAAAGVGTVPALRPGEPAFSTNFFDLFVGFDTSVNGNKFFGSHRYWAREDGTESLRLRLVAPDGDVNKSIQLQAPKTHTGITTYTFPSTPQPGYFLKTNATGELEWASVTGSATFDNATLSGITTITNATIHGGSINNTTIGLTTAAAAAFTTINVSGIATVGSVSIGATQVVSSAFQLQNIASLDATTTATIEAAVANAPNTFTELEVTGISTFNGAVNLGSDSADIITVKGTTTFEQNVTGTISTATRATQVDTTATSDNVSYYIPFVSNSSSTTGETVRVGTGISFNPSTNTLDVANIETAAIKHSNGTSAITIDSVGNVGIAQTLTIEGNLTVKGSTTTVNTVTLLVKDPVIELGMQNDSGNLVAPTTNSTTDVGTILHYYTDNAAKKASFFWDLGTGRVSVASSVTENAGAIAVVDWGTLEAGSFLMNGKLTVNDCAGSSDVITCTGTERFLNNITVDAGTF